MADGPRGTVVGVHGVSLMLLGRAGAWTLALVARRAAVAGWALAGAPASAATLAPAAALAPAATMAAVLAVVTAVALVAAVVLGPSVAMGLGVGDGKVLCLGVHGMPRVEGQQPLPPLLLFQHTQLCRGPGIPCLYSWG